MKLRSDPYRVFMRSKTPAGLYARKKWLQQEGEGAKIIKNAVDLIRKELAAERPRPG